MALKEITGSGQIKSATSLPTSAGWTRICDTGTVASQATFDTNTLLGGNIPAVYTHLKLLFTSRTDSTTGQLLMTLNNDATSQYKFAYATTNVAWPAATANWNMSASAAWCHSSSSADVASMMEVIIYDYANATNPKRAAAPHIMASYDGTNIYTRAAMMTYAPTAAITRMALSLSAGNFTQARFTLYGM